MNGAVGLLSSGNWHICEAAVETVLAGGVPRPVSLGNIPPPNAAGSRGRQKTLMQGSLGCFAGDSPPSVGGGMVNSVENTASLVSGISEVSPEFWNARSGGKQVGSKRPKLLNLFA